MERVNNDTRCKKKKSFEKRVHHQVEQGGSPGANAERQEHIPDLANGGICQHTFDVRLRQCAKACQEQRCRADHGNRKLYLRRQRIQHMRTRN